MDEDQQLDVLEEVRLDTNPFDRILFINLFRNSTLNPKLIFLSLPKNRNWTEAHPKATRPTSSRTKETRPTPTRTTAMKPATLITTTIWQ